jgi:hypothetical protein
MGSEGLKNFGSGSGGISVIRVGVEILKNFGSGSGGISGIPVKVFSSVKNKIFLFPPFAGPA